MIAAEHGDSRARAPALHARQCLRLARAAVRRAPSRPVDQIAGLEFHERSHRRSVRPGIKLFEPPPIFGRERASFVDGLGRVVAFVWLPFAGVGVIGFPISQGLRGAIALPLGDNGFLLRVV